MDSVSVEGLYAHESDELEVARLPGEGLDRAGSDVTGIEPPETSQEELAADPRRTGRKSAKNNAPFYVGVGLVALLVAGGYIVFGSETVNQPSQTAKSPAVHQVGSAPVTGPTPLAPAASLANVPVPKSPPAIVHQKYVPKPPAIELGELDHLRGGTPPNTPMPPSTNATGDSGEALSQLHPTSGGMHPAVGSIAGQPGPVVAEGHQVPPAASKASVSPSATALAPAPPGGRSIAAHVPAHKVAPPPAGFAAEPGTQAVSPPKIATAATVNPSPPPVKPAPPVGGSTLTAAQAGTLTPVQQTQLFQLVTDLAIMERDDRIKESVLEVEVQQLSGLLTNKLADFDRRLSIQEAQNAVTGAMQAGTNTAVTTVIGAQSPVATAGPNPAQVPQSPPAPASGPTPTPTAATQGNSADPVQYHVQAASPGLAMLSVVGGDAAPLEVQVGDTIPGYGKVTGVVQQGDSWVVETQSGNID